MSRPHIVDGEFQSDKYPTCPRGKVPLSAKDPTAQDLLWEYAQRRRSVDAEFAADLEWALRQHGYEPAQPVIETAGETAIEQFAREAYEKTGGPTPELGRVLQAYLDNQARLDARKPDPYAEIGRLKKNRAVEIRNSERAIHEIISQNTALKLEIERLQDRLEMRHAWKIVDGEQVRISVDPGSIPDGIECRDETIKLQDRSIDALRTKLSTVEAENGRLSRLEDLVAQAFCRLGPTGYFPTMGAPLSDEIRNALTIDHPEINGVSGCGIDRAAKTQGERT